jgi:ribosomal protein S18 acetylase RimI-like enzyme
MHADSVELDVLSENRAAVRLYLRMGFEITRCLPEFYKINGQLKDAYHMRFHHND